MKPQYEMHLQLHLSANRTQSNEHVIKDLYKPEYCI